MFISYKLSSYFSLFLSLFNNAGGTSGSHIKLISGASGKTIRTIPAPNREEIFVPIQLVTDMDGSEFLLVMTGGQNTAGGVYKIPLFAMTVGGQVTEFIA